MADKRCSSCKQIKPTSEFHKAKRELDGFKYQCKSCTAAASRRRGYYTPATAAAQSRWRKNHPERAHERARRNNLKRYYDISPDDYDALLTCQGGRCAACHTTRPGTYRGRERKYFDVDHDHDSGAIRGLLCHSCNKAIGFARNDPTVLRALATYLE